MLVQSGIAGQETLVPCTLVTGFVTLKHRVRVLCVENNIFLVQVDEINTLLLNFANKKLQSFMPNEELSEYFTDVKVISFTSYGDNELNDVSLLIDYIVDSDDAVDRAIVALVLSIRVYQLCTLSEFHQLKEFLLDRYSSATELALIETLLGGGNELCI